MVLAAWTDYLLIWQLYVILPLILLWLVGGGWLIGLSIRRATGARRFHPAQGIVTSILATLAGGFGFAVIMYLFSTIRKMGGPDDGGMSPLLVAGMVVGALVAVGVSFTVFYAMFKASARQVAQAVLLPAVGIVVLAGAAAGILYKPTVDAVWDQRHRSACVNPNLLLIREVLKTYTDRLEATPKSVQDLVNSMKHVGWPDAADYFRCPGNPEEPVGYVYVPYTMQERKQAAQTIADREKQRAQEEADREKQAAQEEADREKQAAAQERANQVKKAAQEKADQVNIKDRVILADRQDNHMTSVNCILFTAVSRDGKLEQSVQVQSLSKDEFARLLADPINESFAVEYNK